MKIFPWAIAAMLSAILAWPPDCHAEDGGVENFILDKGTLKIFRVGDEYMVEKLPEVKFENGVKVNNCNEYLEALKTSNPEDTTWNRIFECRYSGCAQVRALQNAKPHNGYRPKSYAVELFNRLDLGSFPTDIVVNERVVEGMKTLANFKLPFVRIEDDYTIVYNEPEVWWEKIMVVSDADINGNGKPDWFLDQQDKALRGSAVDCTPLVIYDVEPTGLLKATLMARGASPDRPHSGDDK